MKVIKIPGEITFRNMFTRELTDQKATFQTFIQSVLMAPDWLQGGYPWIKAALKVDQGSQSEDGVMRLEEADYEKLKSIIEKPGTSYGVNNALAAMQLIPFIDAILNAQTE